MSEVQEIHSLLYGIIEETTSEIFCDKCDEYEMFAGRQDKAAVSFHSKGWRYVNDESLCRKCSQQAENQ